MIHIDLILVSMQIRYIRTTLTYTLSFSPYSQQPSPGIVIIGSNGFIRQVAVSLHNAVSATDWLKTEEFLLLAIPSTLGPKPSYRAADVLSLNPTTVSADDDSAARDAFWVRGYYFMEPFFGISRINPPQKSWSPLMYSTLSLSNVPSNLLHSFVEPGCAN